MSYVNESAVVGGANDQVGGACVRQREGTTNRSLSKSGEEALSNRQQSHETARSSSHLTTSNNERTPLIRSSQRHNSYRNSDTTQICCQGSINRSGTSLTESKMNIVEWLGDVSIPVYILVMFFAVASWVDINGLWVEMPLLVQTLPEGWNLPSYIVIIIQVANIGPIAYTIANRLAPNKVKEWPVVYIIIAIGAASCLLLTFFWDRTTVFPNGNEYSTALLSLSTSLSLVDCTSSVVFLPYMAIFKPQYMTAFYIGEGLSGLIPGLVGLAQGVGGDPICVNTSHIVTNTTTGENTTEWVIEAHYKDPNFSVEVFFFFLFGLLCVSMICFTVINFAPFAKRETLQNVYSYDLNPSDGNEPYYVKTTDIDSGTEDEMNDYKIELGKSRTYSSSRNESQPGPPETSNVHLTNQIVTDNRDEDGKDIAAPALSTKQFIFILFITAWVNGLTNGVLPSTQSYSALPYGNLAYTLSVRLGTVANPLACFMALLIPTNSLVVVASLSGVGSMLAGYQLYLAAMSPTPPLQGHVGGEVLCILTFVILTGLFSYTKVTIASLLQAEGGRRALLWCGAVTQIGSFCGAIITFILVNVLQLFQSTYPCT